MNLSFDIESLSRAQYILLALNILAIIFSRLVFKKIFERYGEKDRNSIITLNTFRVINIFLLVAFLGMNLFSSLKQNSTVDKAFAGMLIVYGSYFIYHALAYVIELRFAKSRSQPDGSEKIVDTYNSRVLKFISGIFISVTAGISLIQLFEFTGLLETRGVLGFIGVFIALTQASWAPDLISGLIILNSKLIDEGDVIELSLDGEKITSTIFRVKVFHTELLGHVSNHRMMIRNSKFRDLTIHSLSRFASARGLREGLSFNIGYDTDASRVVEFFKEVFETAQLDKDIKISPNHDYELRVTDTGDDAIEWTVFYYTKDVSCLIRTRQLLRSQIMELAVDKEISLATPKLLTITEPQLNQA